MNDIIFRPATADDLPTLVAMLADDALGATREDASLPLDQRYLAAFAAMEADPNQHLVVAERDGAIVGMLQLSFIPGLSLRGAWRAQIEGVRIASTMRGKGLGEAMLRWAFAESARNGCTSVQLTTNKARTDAKRFYERLGFTASHEGMKRPLP